MTFEDFRKGWKITDKKMVNISFTGTALEIAYNAGVREYKQKVREAFLHLRERLGDDIVLMEEDIKLTEKELGL